MKFDLSRAAHPALKGAVAPADGANYRRLFVPSRDIGSQGNQLLEDERRPPSIFLRFLTYVHLGIKNTHFAEALNVSSSFLYSCAFSLSAGLGVAFCFKPSVVSLTSMDGFAWVVWALMVIGEICLVLSRLMARWDFLGDAFERRHVVERGGRIGALWGMLVRRDAFGNCCQALIVCVCQLAGSVFFVIGSLAVVSRMLMHRDERERDLAIVYTIIFAFVNFSFILTSVVDTLRTKQLDSPHGWEWALELQAWRLVLLMFAMSIVTIGYCIYVHVCCDGDWAW